MLATFSYRYYPDAMFLLVLFSALACQNSRALGPPSEPRRVLTGRGGSLYAVPALAAVLCVAITSFRTSTSDLGFLCESQSRIRDYMRNVTTGLEPLRRESRPPLFLEGQVPPFVNPIGGWVSQHSVLVGAMGLHARFVPNARAAYRILPTGEVVFGAS